ncbi:hypothetical protein BH24ACT1_BH24ACT1_04460 [soil metagenome]
MLTRQGAIATAVSVALVVAGRLFAIFELFLIGAGGAALVIGAVVVTGLTRLRLDVSRDLRPPRIHAGEASTVTLLVTNGGRRRTPVIQLRDAVGPGRTASVVLSPLAPGENVTAVYTLPGEHRGLVGVGPLEVRVSDPFGLAALSVPAAPAVELTVWPLVERVMAPSLTVGRDHDVGPPTDLAPSGDEFYALRPYADGDDLRRVHWRASAKRDDLVVRQDERPSQGTVTIVLDTRAGTYKDDTFERAVSAAASIAVAAARQGHILRLVTTAGHDSGSGGSGPGIDHIEAILDHLAVVQLREAGHLATVVSTMERAGARQGGRIVVVTGEEHPGRADRSRMPSVSLDTTLVVFTDSLPGPPVGNGSVVVVQRSTSFASAWNRAAAASSSFVGV